MKKTTCDECNRKRQCNTMDRTRGMPCKDFEKYEETKQEDKQ